MAPLNVTVSKLNNVCLDRMPGEDIILGGINKTVDPNDATSYTSEYIESLEAPGIPPSKLRIKVGAPIILLRNLNSDIGLVNGTRLIVKDVINGRLIKAEIAVGQHKGRLVLLPKIPLRPADATKYGFEWERLQFPIRLAFAMTINKAQGQTLEKVSVWLKDPCFGHGQLYVAISRVGDPQNIMVFTGKKVGMLHRSTRNVVYEEL